MSNILMGRGKEFRERPEGEWREELAQEIGAPSARLQFMTPEHHRIRDTVVTELPREGSPLTPSWIAERTGLPADRVNEILAELEAHLFFLVRNDDGNVAWAYPVTSDPTPHRLRFESGENIFAA